MQGLGEFVELQLADLESLAARLELGSLGREAGLLLGNSLLPQRQSFSRLATANSRSNTFRSPFL